MAPPVTQPFVSQAPVQNSVPALDSFGQLVRHVGPLTTTQDELKQAQRIDEVNANLMYVGTAAIGSADAAAVWSIKRVQKVGNVTSIMWAAGGAYTQIWNNRAALVYT